MFVASSVARRQDPNALSLGIVVIASCPRVTVSDSPIPSFRSRPVGGVLLLESRYQGTIGYVDLSVQPRIQRWVGESRVIVAGINKVKKHQKSNPQQGIPGGIIDKELPIAVSNIAILNPSTNKADRVGLQLKEGKKIRIFKSDGKAIDE